MLKDKKLLLIDGHGLIYRAYYALQKTDMATSKGIKTWAVYGFIHLFLRAIDEQKPDYLAISFDLHPPTVRLEQFSEYKAQRQETPDDMKSQIPYILKFVDAMGIPIFEYEGYEADDCIATLCKRGEEKEARVFILSGDTDLFQLVSDRTNVIYPDRSAKQLQYYDVKAVRERYGLEPHQLIDFKALQGDSSDNIPGLPGIGKVTATKLLQEFGNIENIIASGDKIKSEKIKKVILENQDKAFEGQKLVRLYSDLPLNINWEECSHKEPYYDKLADFFDEMEFKGFMERYGLKAKKKTVEIDCETIIVNSKEIYNNLISDLETSEWVSLSCFSYNSNNLFKPLLGIGFTTEKSNYYIPCTYKDINKKEISQGLLFEEEEEDDYYLDTEFILKGLKKFLENEKLLKYGFDLKSLYIQMAGYGIKLAGIKFDAKLAAFLLDSEKANPSLSYIVSKYLSINIPSPEDMLGKGKKAMFFEELPLSDIAPYSSRITYLSWKLINILTGKLYELSLERLFNEIEIPLISLLARMEMRGISIDGDLLKHLSSEADEELKKLSGEIYNLAGEEFNINSPKQLGDILFKKLSISGGSKSKTGYSTASEVLEPLREEYKIIDLVLNYRELNKLKTTYIDVLPSLVDPFTGRLHTNFNQMVTATGRLSSSEPNLQNIPVRTRFGRLVRKALHSSDNNLLLSADYSQIELRILAHYSGSEKLIDIFKRGYDIHTETAREIFELTPDLTPDSNMRRIAKTVNFGIIYGISDFGLSRNLLIDRKDAKKYIENYFEKYPEIKSYIDRAIVDAREKGFVTTLSNRRRNLPKISDRNFNIRKGEERIAINAPIQGSAADIIKIAMINIEKDMEDKNLKSTMVLQIHDELVFHMAPDEASVLPELVKFHMENAMSLNVPLLVEIKCGKDLSHMDALDLLNK